MIPEENYTGLQNVIQNFGVAFLKGELLYGSDE